MNLKNRQNRAKRRAKSMRLIKNQKVPHTCSKWSVHGVEWLGKSDGLQPREMQSLRRKLGTKRFAADQEGT